MQSCDLPQSTLIPNPIRSPLAQPARPRQPGQSRLVASALAVLILATGGPGGTPTATAADSTRKADAPKPFGHAAEVTIPSDPIHGTVHGKPWTVKRAKISGGKLHLYADATQPTPVLELQDLPDALHNSLGKALLEKALSGDKEAQSRLKKIPAKPALESARIALDNEDGLLGLTHAQIRRADGTIYHCDAGSPVVIEFGSRKDGKVTVGVYFRHEFGTDHILLAGTVEATVE